MKENKNYLKNEVKPFGIKDKLGYMLGDMGNDFVFIFTNMYLMIFYTKVLGIKGAVVGTLFVISRIIDAFTDITMGTIVDKVKSTKDGKFRPWIKRMSGPFTIATFLMYQSSLAHASMTVKIIYMFVTYILWGSIFYTSINIPYGSMASVISGNSVDRAYLSTFRNLGDTFANVIIGVIAPLVIYNEDSSVNPKNFTMIAGVFSILSFVCYYSCYKMSTERISVNYLNENKEKVSIFKDLAGLLKNKALIANIIASICILLGTYVAQTMNQYLFTDYFSNRKALSALSIVGLPVTLFAAAVSVRLGAKFGKKEVSAVSMIFAGCTLLLAYALKIKNPWVYVGMFTLAQVGNMIYSMLRWANITDVIDYNEITTGERNDGKIYGVYSFSRKLGQALAGGVAGFTISAIGYNGNAITQTLAVKNGIYAISSGFVGAFFLLAGIIYFTYCPLKKNAVEENAKKLAEMRRNK